MQYHGVNLGGWLVAERWMTPSLFRGVQGKGERDIIRSLGDEGRQRLDQHRNSFITVEDIRWIADRGYNALRVPVGYWIIDGDEGYHGGLHHLDSLFEWAKACNLAVVLDLHGLPGSQNGKHHSGEQGVIGFYNSKNINIALDVIKTLLDRYGRNEHLVGLQIMNEQALSPQVHQMMRYARKASRVINQYSDIIMIVSDGFHPRLFQVLLWTYGVRDCVVDHHWYHVFGKRERSEDFTWHQRLIAKRAHYMAKSRYQSMVGEWTAAMPSTVKGYRNEAMALQSEAYRKSAWGDFYWSYKTEGGGSWSLRHILESKQ